MFGMAHTRGCCFVEPVSSYSMLACQVCKQDIAVRQQLSHSQDRENKTTLAMSQQSIGSKCMQTCGKGRLASYSDRPKLDIACAACYCTCCLLLQMLFDAA